MMQDTIHDTNKEVDEREIVTYDVLVYLWSLLQSHSRQG